MSGPERIKNAVGLRERFHHVIAIMPTILEAARVPAPGLVPLLRKGLD